MAATGRILFIDVVRGMGICCIVAAHAGLHWNFDHFFQLSDFWSSAVGLFFFVSGFLFNEAYSAELFFKKRLRGLYLPFVLFNLMFLAMHNILYDLHFYDDVYYVQDFFRVGWHILTFDLIELYVAPLWFLLPLFLAEVIFFFLYRFCTIKSQTGLHIKLLAAAMLFYCAGACLLAEGISPMHGACAFLNISFMVIWSIALGWLVRQQVKKGNDPMRIFFKHHWFIAAAAVLLFLQNLVHFQVDYRVAGFTNLYLFPLFELSFIYVLFYAAAAIVQYGGIVRSIFGYIGAHTLFILALHILFFKFVGLYQVTCWGMDPHRLLGWQNVNTDGVWGAVYVLLGLAGPLVIERATRPVRSRISLLLRNIV